MQVVGLDIIYILMYNYICSLKTNGVWLRAHSSAGRASALQAGGHRFEPCCAHQNCWHGSTVEQLICNQQVVGSIPIASSNDYGGVPEWPKGADCKSVVFDFDGSNPSSSTKETSIYNRCFFFIDFIYIYVKIYTDEYKI